MLVLVCARGRSVPEKSYCQGGRELHGGCPWSPVGEDSKVLGKVKGRVRDMVDVEKEGSVEEGKTM
jgi:hypothetical protein